MNRREFLKGFVCGIAGLLVRKPDNGDFMEEPDIVAEDLEEYSRALEDVSTAVKVVAGSLEELAGAALDVSLEEWGEERVNWWYGGEKRTLADEEGEIRLAAYAEWRCENQRIVSCLRDNLIVPICTDYPFGSPDDEWVENLDDIVFDQECIQLEWIGPWKMGYGPKSNILAVKKRKEEETLLGFPVKYIDSFGPLEIKFGHLCPTCAGAVNADSLICSDCGAQWT